MPASALMRTRLLRSPWDASSPYLFCAYHNDRYPSGTETLGLPSSALKGRELGSDFSHKDGYSLYHGCQDERLVPGFPQHPHRGFETITVVRSGLCDHTDSTGASARFGQGDAQWITTGKGVSHAEMFPLINRDAPNPLDLFQIWLNLPKERKLVDPNFLMLWEQDIPKVKTLDENNRETEVTLVTGNYGQHKGPKTPPHSWAADPNNYVAVWIIKMSARAKWTFSGTVAGLTRTLYYYAGNGLTVDNATSVAVSHAMELQSDLDLVIENGDSASELLLLQGRPIDESVAKYGPFVMNTQTEIQQTFREYQQTRFGGWEWPSDSPVHPRGQERFARYPDGSMDKPSPQPQAA